MSDLHVAIVGAGALGSVYGTRLALHNTRVTFVVRPGREAETSPIRIQRVGDSHVLELASAQRAAAIPADADLVALAVRVDNVDDKLDALLSQGPKVPVLTLTPFMPGSLERLRNLLGPRVVVAMPGVVAYANDAGLIRYWLPRSQPTLIDDRAASDPVMTSLVQRLQNAGISVRFEPRVDSLNPATTLTFLPLVIALDVAGGTADRAVADRALLSLALDAVAECRKAAAFVGATPAWAGVLAKFVGPTAIRVGIGLARRTFPESVTFVERHFGSKTHAQNVLLAREGVELGRSHGLPMTALSRLADRCAARQ